MQKWEYLVVLPTSQAVLENWVEIPKTEKWTATVPGILKHYGENSWELVTAIDSEESGYEFFFKRPIP